MKNKSKKLDIPDTRRYPKRKKGEHLWHEHDGVTKCVTCFCDEDDAFVGGQKCSFGEK